MTLCSNCGANPCYHLCYNSPHYYSPEQERADEPFYGDDDHRERYAGEIIDGELEGHYAAMDDECDDDREADPTTFPLDDEGDTYRANDDGTVTLITATGGEHTYDPSDLVTEVFNEVYPPRPINPDDIPF